MSFLIPASMDIAAVHNLLERLTGAKVTINTIKPNYDHIHQGSNIEKYITHARSEYCYLKHMLFLGIL